MNVEAIYSSDLPESLKADWDKLLKSTHVPNFQSDFFQLQSWLKNVNKDWSPLLLVVKDNENVLGIVPLMYMDIYRRKIIPERLVRVLGSTHTDFTTVLSENENMNAVINATMKWLYSGEFRWERLIIDDIEEGDALADSLLRWKNDNESTVCEVSEGSYYYIDLSNTWDDIMLAASKKFVRRNINLARNRTDKAGEWRIQTASELGWDVETQIREAGVIHKERQKTLERPSIYSDESMLNYLTELLSHTTNNKTLVSYWLILNDQPIAYMFGFLQNNSFYAWNMAFKTEFSNLFPSKLLLFYIIKDCHEKQMKEFHFMRGETDYKEKWTKSTRINYRFEFRNTKSIYGKIAAFVDKLK